LKLKSTDPLSVAIAFFHAMIDFDNNPHVENNREQVIPSPPTEDITTPNSSQEFTDTEGTTTNEETKSPGAPTLLHNDDQTTPTRNNFLSEFYHVLQYCFLCYKGKITPVHYTLDKSTETSNWFNNLRIITFPSNRTSSKRQNNIDLLNPNSDDETENPINKISRKDQHFIDTMLKSNESIDKNIIKSNQEKAEKEPGFTCLEYYKKNMILNASAIPLFDEQASTPTEFLIQFMGKKNHFKAKEMLFHRLSIDNAPFHPNTQMVSCLWNGDFMWLTPDCPSGVSIFFCPELSTINSAELEKDRTLPLADKVKHGDLEKLSKQKFTIPTNIMEKVWMTQNFHSIVSLCFGPQSHSAIFLDNWAKHMYHHRLMYKSLLASDPTFFVQVLFFIDRALQIHWKSCCDNNQRDSVNNRILMMQDKQDLII
jgi:hypothetical protein